MEREFKVGDSVRFGLIDEKHGKIAGKCRICGAWIVETKDGEFKHAEKPAPYIPEGWTSADEPPDSDRDIRLLSADGEKLGWYDGVWFSYQPGSNNAVLADELSPDEVIGWREIEAEQPEATLHYVSPSMSTAKAYAAKPEPTPRWCVAANLPTTITTWHDTYEGAVNEAKRLFKKTGQTFRVLEVVMEIEPGDPVIREYTDIPF